MSQVSPVDNPTPSRRAPATPLQRVESVEDLDAQLGRHLVRSRRQGDLVALLWLEIDLLTLTDPTLGGGSRDTVAEAVGARLRHRVRRTDHVFQVGGTGFAVLLDTDKAGAGLVERRLIEELRGPYGMEGGLAHVHLNIGLACASEAHGQGRSLLRSAMDDLAARRPPSPDSAEPATAASA